MADDSGGIQIKRHPEPDIFCPECLSPNVIVGKLGDGGYAGVSHLCFFAGKMKWYKFSDHRGLSVANRFHCCRDCGVLFSRYRPDALERIIQKKCVVNDVGKMTSESSPCILCGMKRVWKGRLFLSYNYRGNSLLALLGNEWKLYFNPEGVKKQKALRDNGAIIQDRADFCLDCGLITTRLEPWELRSNFAANHWK